MGFAFKFDGIDNDYGDNDNSTSCFLFHHHNNIILCYVLYFVLIAMVNITTHW
jgi:hypothetical protein